MNWSPTVSSALCKPNSATPGSLKQTPKIEVGAEAIDGGLEVTGGDDDLAQPEHAAW